MPASCADESNERHPVDRESEAARVTPSKASTDPASQYQTSHNH